MKSPLKILHLEDDPHDALLIRATLTEAGIANETVLVDNRAGFCAALEREGFDLVLADCRLPSFNGLEALDIVRARSPEMPFLFVTGAIGEEQAIETLKRGATDYVLKDRLSRLEPAVRRALAETEEHASRRQAEDERERLVGQLAWEQALLAEVLRQMPAGVIVADPNGRMILGNEQAAQIWRQRFVGAQEISGYDAWPAFHPDGRPYGLDERPLVRALQRGELVSNEEIRFVRGDQSQGTMLTSAAPVRDREGRVIAAVATFTDITERLRAEEALQQSERRFHAAVDHIPGGFVIYDERRRLQFVNAEALRTSGRRTGEMLGRRDEELFPEAYTAQYLPTLKRAIATRSHQVVEVTTPSEMGGRTLTVTFVPVLDAGGTIQQVLGVTHDVTDERRAAGEIHRLNAELEQRVADRTVQLQVAIEALKEEIAERKHLEKQVLEIAEREQRRIGQDLHDGLSQQLAGVAYLSGTLHGQLTAQSSPEAPQTARIVTLLKEAIEQTRNLARGLRPVEREPNGLMSALQQFAAAVRELFGVTCQFRCPQPVLVDDNALAVHLYRIAQEAVHNGIRHGKTKRIQIDLEKSPDAHSLVLRIRDFGQGIDRKPGRAGGMGLSTMRYRAESMGGRLSIQRGPRKGTVVTCEIPLATGKTAVEKPENRKG